MWCHLFTTTGKYNLTPQKKGFIYPEDIFPCAKRMVFGKGRKLIGQTFCLSQSKTIRANPVSSFLVELFGNSTCCWKLFTQTLPIAIVFSTSRGTDWSGHFPVGWKSNESAQFLEIQLFSCFAKLWTISTFHDWHWCSMSCDSSQKVSWFLLFSLQHAVFCVVFGLQKDLLLLYWLSSGVKFNPCDTLGHVTAVLMIPHEISKC